MATLSLPVNASVAPTSQFSNGINVKADTDRMNDYLSSEDRYGDFVEAVYQYIDDKEEYPDFIPLYGKSTVLEKSGMPLLHENYTVTRYLYATVKGLLFFLKSNVAYFGMVAVSNEEQTKRLGYREIVVAIRGTIAMDEWLKNASTLMVRAPFCPWNKDARVHRGFLSMYSSSDASLVFGSESLQTQISKEIQAQLQLCPKEQDVKIVFAGHSLGSALATLAAADHSINRSVSLPSNVKLSLVGYGSPKVGDANFKSLVEDSGLEIKRYSSVFDIVPMVPLYSSLFPIGQVQGTKRWYEHVGPELAPLWVKSDYVDVSKLMGDMAAAVCKDNLLELKPSLFRFHNLQLYLHTIAAESFSDVNVVDVAQQEAPITAGLKLLFSNLFGDESVARLAPYFDRMASVEYSLPPSETQHQVKRARVVKVMVKSPFDRRDHALLNRDSDALKLEFKIPRNWCVPPNKDMVLNDKTLTWQPRYQRPDDIPTPENPEYN